MKWINEPGPITGTNRTRKVFAWIPTKMSFGKITVWLEYYTVIEVWECITPVYGLFNLMYWVAVEKSPICTTSNPTIPKQNVAPPPPMSKPLTEGLVKTQVKEFKDRLPMAAPPPAPFPPIKIIKCPDHWE